MPEITALGWFHTVMGIIALVSGGIALFRHKEITLQARSGQIYLVTTLITAATALAIFQHGGFGPAPKFPLPHDLTFASNYGEAGALNLFGPAHGLAVMTLAALLVGTVASITYLFGRFSRHVRAVSYTATLLFHSIPAVTDGLMRLPVGDPVLSSIEDPLLKQCYLVLLVLFLLGVSLQLRWISRQASDLR